MKRAILTIALAVSVSFSANASAQTRVDIMNFVIWPCINSIGTEPYVLSDDEEIMTDNMIFLLHRDYFERMISIVKTAVDQYYPETKLSTIYSSGQIVCILYHPARRRIGQ